MQDRVVELARHLQRIPVGAGRLDAGDVGRLRAFGRLHGQGRGAARRGRSRRSTCGYSIASSLDRLLQRRQRDALAVGRAVALRRELARALLHALAERLRLHDLVDEPPVLRLLAAHAFAGRAEDVGVVMAHMALVGQPRQAAGAGQHAEQRHLGQADRGGAVVDQDDLVAGRGELVAAAGAGAVHRGEELETAVAARVLEAVARLVGELAEVHLPRVAALAEHEDVGAGAEHAVAAAGQDHACAPRGARSGCAAPRRSARCRRRGRSC